MSARGGEIERRENREYKLCFTSDQWENRKRKKCTKKIGKKVLIAALDEDINEVTKYFYKKKGTPEEKLQEI